MRLILNLGGAINGFDSYGHFLRAQLPVNNCVDYVTGISEIVCDAHSEARRPPPRPRPGPRSSKLAEAPPVSVEPPSEPSGNPGAPRPPRTPGPRQGGTRGTHACCSTTCSARPAPDGQKGGQR